MSRPLFAPSAGLHPGLGGGVRPVPAIPPIVVGDQVEVRFSQRRIFGILLAKSVRGPSGRLNAGHRPQDDEDSGIAEAADIPPDGVRRTIGSRSSAPAMVRLVA